MKAGTKFTDDQLQKLRKCIDACDDAIDQATLTLFIRLGLVQRINLDERFTLDNPFIDLTSKGRLVLNTGIL